MNTQGGHSVLFDQSQYQQASGNNPSQQQQQQQPTNLYGDNTQYQQHQQFDTNLDFYQSSGYSANLDANPDYNQLNDFSYSGEGGSSNQYGYNYGQPVVEISWLAAFGSGGFPGEPPLLQGKLCLFFVFCTLINSNYLFSSPAK
ncbi:hypothetical protein AX774_g6276 [Zancudomyces culisetae]|uniref:Uncharacterized protein n=1 Tax=Zancudomyces culisetae TaxID=1213189 RepID=A0A1R1PH41_ZANCU|nr:hypothetical protein AX774_g6276 [Zancudomyces culisetae]|eukprot:OMH80290.1 hypothetical protein AX774_g6276 [Zancudomyces culisetae]